MLNIEWGRLSKTSFSKKEFSMGYTDFCKQEKRFFTTFAEDCSFVKKRRIVSFSPLRSLSVSCKYIKHLKAPSILPSLATLGSDWRSKHCNFLPDVQLTGD